MVNWMCVKEDCTEPVEEKSCFCRLHLTDPLYNTPEGEIRALKAQLEAVRDVADAIMTGIARGEQYGPYRRDIYNMLIKAIGESDAKETG
jgi:hypothetical protein